ncbi:MAG: AMP-binding protein [Rhizobiaceae bacterium]|nr:AMP-binding protein [Rhizobiaceae bacterium]
MLQNLPTYEEIYREFRWHIPEYFNIGDAICEKFAIKEPGRIALIGWNCDGKPDNYTYGQLHKNSNRLANVFADLGLKAGERVGIILPQSIPTALTHIAVYKSGAIAVPLARLFAPDALVYRLKHSGARIVVTNQEGYEKISTVRGDLPDLETVLVVDGDGGLDFERVVKAANAQFSSVNTKSDEPALIIYTSGTTGPPKGALHAHRVLLGHIPGLQTHHEFIPKPQDVAWTPADWAWAGGLLNILLPCLYMGVPVVYGGMNRFDAETAFRLMSETKTTCAFIPPTAMRLMKTVDKPAKRFPLKIRTIGSGGESLGLETCLWAKKELGVEINEFYGQTECNLVLSGFGARGVAKPGSIGKPVPGHNVALLNNNKELCKPGETGEVVIARPDPVMFLKYWKDEKATADKFYKDWMLTGDQCVQDEAGYFDFVGRDDDIISSAGYRLGPGEIEDCLISHPAVKLAVAVGKPDQLRGEIIKAYVVLKDGYSHHHNTKDLIGEIQLHVKGRLAANIYPREIELVEEIPLTTTGKVIRRTFRQRAIDEVQSAD